MTQLKGLVTIITGGAHGIGEATARRFAADGATVIISDIKAERGKAVAKEIGGEFFSADVTVEDQVEALVAEAVHRHGRLDCMINNAGLLGPLASIAETAAADWNHTMAILLGAVFFGMKHSARVMIGQRSGVILSTASIAGFVALGPHAYTTAKHAVVGLTKSVASELAAHGIRVNAVAPGTVPTELTRAFWGSHEAVREYVASSTPLGHAIEPGEMAGAFAYLAGPDGRSITGQIITVDGGLTACPTAVRTPPPKRYSEEGTGTI